MVPKNKKPTFADAGAISLLTQEVHSRRAVNCLIRRQYGELDAPIGDALCHARVGPVNAAADKIHTWLEDNGGLENALSLVKVYEAKFANMPSDGRIKVPADIKDEGRDGREYEELYSSIVQLLGHDHMKTLALFFSKTTDCIRSFTPCGTSFSRRSTNLYHSTNPTAEASKKPKDRDDMDSDLRVELGTKNMDYMEGWLASLGQLVEDSPEDALGRHLENDSAKVVLPNGKAYPVASIFAAFHFMFLHEYKARRPIVVSVRRIALKDNGFTWTQQAVLFYKANEKGGWSYVEHPTAEERNRPATWLNCWSTFKEGSEGSSLASSDNAQFLEALKEADPAWLTHQYSANHPAFAGRADRKKFPGEEELQQMAPMVTSKIGFTETHCPGLTFALQQPGETRQLDLADIWMSSYLGGHRNLGLEDCVEYAAVEGGRNEIYSYASKPFPFVINHVQSGTYNTVKSELDERWSRYEAVNKPEFSYTFCRYGSSAYHAGSLEAAHAFINMKPKAQKAFIAEQGLEPLYAK